MKSTPIIVHFDEEKIIDTTTTTLGTTSKY